MILKTLTLTAEGQAPVEVTVPAAPAAATVGVALPRLAPGTYTAAWTAEGPDGHKMSGSAGFGHARAPGTRPPQLTAGSDRVQRLFRRAAGRDGVSSPPPVARTVPP